MPQPGTFNPRGEDFLVREIADLKRQIRELSAANVFGTTGLKPRDGGTEFDGYVTINGDATITGALSLPAGSGTHQRQDGQGPGGFLQRNPPSLTQGAPDKTVRAPPG